MNHEKQLKELEDKLKLLKNCKDKLEEEKLNYEKILSPLKTAMNNTEEAIEDIDLEISLYEGWIADTELELEPLLEIEQYNSNKDYEADK